MKSLKFLLLLLLLQSLFSNISAQKKTQTPADNEAKSSLIRNEEYSMGWYALKDTLKMEIGKVTTKITKDNTRLIITSTIKMKNNPDWVDETVVEFPGLKSVKHTSVNSRREMLLDFGKENLVTGYYLDKAKGKKTEINEKVSAEFFDSNFYPQLIRWLPLKDGYTTEISIFDYNPDAAIGSMKAYITGTQKGTYKNKTVWVVISVTDDISKNQSVSTYYIDSKTREVMKQEITAGPRKMLMERL